MTDLPDRMRRVASLGAALTLLDEASDEIERLRAALQSIAGNTCCDKCQEAALVAKTALGERHERTL